MSVTLACEYGFLTTLSHMLGLKHTSNFSPSKSSTTVKIEVSKMLHLLDLQRTYNNRLIEKYEIIKETLKFCWDYPKAELRWYLIFPNDLTTYKKEKTSMCLVFP